MNRQEAALVRLRLMAHRAFGAMVENRRGGSEEAQKDLDAIDWAIATIQSKIARPQPDPITGLVPCGCGGKAKQEDFFDGFFYFGAIKCPGCEIEIRIPSLTPEESSDRVKVAWNRAMGRASE